MCPGARRCPDAPARRVGNQWVPDGKLIAHDAGEFDHFGESVAVHGDTIAVGAYDATHSELLEPGAVYVFRRTMEGWVQEAKLIASDPHEFQGFGWSVAVGPDTVAVGARFDEEVAEVSGAVYVFTRTAGVWSQQAVLTAGDPKEFDSFGWTVDIDGDAIVVGLRDNITVGNHSARGAAYVFRGAGASWTQEVKLIAADAMPPDGFDNVAVAIEGDTVVMGVKRDYVGYQTSGSAYVFARTADVWQQQAKLLPPDVELGLYYHFTLTVALSDGQAVIGADGSSYGSVDPPKLGAAYVYDVSTFATTQQRAGSVSDRSR
jgi:hypothetical protein